MNTSPPARRQPCARRSPPCAEWQSVALLYEGLTRVAPTLGVHVARAVPVAEAARAAAGWMPLEAIDASKAARYQPYWAARG